MSTMSASASLSPPPRRVSSGSTTSTYCEIVFMPAFVPSIRASAKAGVAASMTRWPAPSRGNSASPKTSAMITSPASATPTQAREAPVDNSSFMRTVEILWNRRWR